MKIAIIPVWVRKALEASNKELHYATDLKTLSTILSLDDVAFYLSTNTMLHDFVTELDLSFFDKFHSALDCGIPYFKELDEETSEALSRLYTHYMVRPPVSRAEAMFGRLSDVDSNVIGYSVKLLDEETLAVLPHVLDEGADTTKAALHFADEVIKTHLITTPFETVASTQHFKKYIALLGS